MLAHARLELVPLRGLADQSARLSPGTTVTVTCSPRRGIEHTLDAGERLRAQGLEVVPHLSARLVQGGGHLRAIVRRLDGAGIEDAFVVGGDVPEPVGPYDSALAMLRDMAEIGAGPARIGVAGYPERHPLIGARPLIEALRGKQALASYVVTQICYDPRAVFSWIETIRNRGIDLPVWIGFPGPLSRRKLLEISLRVGVGDSLRYVRKHGGLVARLMRRSFRPDDFLAGISGRLSQSNPGVRGFHVNTFNQLEAVERWRQQALTAAEDTREKGEA